MKNHKIVGSVYNIDLQSFGSFADCMVKRAGEFDSPLILGLFVSLVMEDKPDRCYLARVESLKPDENKDGISLKDALRLVEGTAGGVDPRYKEDVLTNLYRLRILGVCEETDESIKFFSNVRTLPAQTSLKVAIPSSDFMTKLFKSAVADSDDGTFNSFEIGTLKYGTFPEYTNAFYDASTAQRVPVLFNAANLLRKRTAIFGKSGYGKSNAVKTVIGMMATKFPDCGQIIFDTNGEYALENDQNDGFMDIFHEANLKGRTVLYTSRKIHAAKKEKFGSDSFKPLKFDVFENITAALDIVVANMAGATIPMYLQAWVNEAQGVEDQSELFATATHSKGIIWGMWFKACLDAGLIPNGENAQIASLVVSKDFLNEIVSLSGGDEEDAPPPVDAEDGSEGLEAPAVTFDAMDKDGQDDILKQLGISRNGKKFITRNIRTMAKYAEWKAIALKAQEKAKKKGDATRMEDDKESSLKAYVELLQYYRRLYQLKGYNLGQLPAEERRGAKSISLGESVWADLLNKKIIMIDLASVPGNVAKCLSEQIAATLLNKASQLFGDTELQAQFKKFDGLVFIEEAQNYLSKEQVAAGTGIWERLAKEGRKFHLGLVYVTQQPSAIDEKISSQTENIIALHMSNGADTMFLNRIKDKFDELTCKFLKDEAQKGLAYIYAEPHQPFVLPAQIHKFDKDLILAGLKKSKKG